MMKANMSGSAHLPKKTTRDMMLRFPYSWEVLGADNLQPQSSEVQGQASISPESLWLPSKAPRRDRSSPAAAGDP